MTKMHVPLIEGRPLILWPDDWQHGWKDPSSRDGNAELSQHWSLEGWKEFRELYYLGLMPCPFGYDTSDPHAPWPGVPFAPWGMSKRHREPRLHPSDE